MEIAMRQNFDACLSLTLLQEGGYVDDKNDPGGATNMGITRVTLACARGHAVSKADVKNLSREEAATIYRNNYWAAIRGDDLPAGLDAVMFDHAVNSGPKAAVRTLQAALDLPQNGLMGLRTLRFAKAADVEKLISQLCARRMSFLQRLSTWIVFRRGWTARVDSVERAALSMFHAAQIISAPIAMKGTDHD
jgi:lysozyme family protein